MEIGITNAKVLLIAKLIITNFSETFATFAIKSFKVKTQKLKQIFVYVNKLLLTGDVFTALNKAWCVNHFACSSCDQKMTVKTKFYEVDLKPVCKKCYDR